MNHIKLKCISAVVACAVTASALSGSLRIMEFDRRVRAAEAARALGDVNGDGKVSAEDAQMALAAAAEIIVGNDPDLDEEQKVAADIDYNKDVTPIDAQYILMYFLHESVMDDPISWYALTGINPPAAAVPQMWVPEELEMSVIRENIEKLDYSVATPDQPVETSLTGEMTKVFHGMTPTEAYENLYNSVNTEFYFGSRKGAIGTYEESGGNDIDQASLLIAVLRYLGYEADYITALVELTPEQMKEITCTDDAEVAYQIFRKQTSADKKTVDALRDDAGNLTGMDIEHTWVTAKIPSKYVNGDNSDELVEVQLDTSFKKKYREKLGDSMKAFVGDANYDQLSQAIAAGDYSALENILAGLSVAADEEQANQWVSERPGKSFSFVPAAENMIVSEQQLIGSDYLKGRTDQILINIGGKNAALVNAPDAYGKQFVIEYEFDDDYELFEEFLLDVPDTIFDITNYYSNLGIKIQPNIKLDGRTIGSGGSVELGTEQKMTITLYTGGGVQELDTTNMLSGSMYAITLDMQNISDDEIFRRMQKYPHDAIQNRNFRRSYSAKDMGSMLSAIGTQYMAEADMMRKNLEEEADVHTERFMSICVSAFNLEITKNMVGEIKAEERGTLGLDVKSDSYTAVSLNNRPEDEDEFYENAGVGGSYLEGTVLEDLTGIESVSTMKVLDTAIEQGVDIVSISKDNPDYTTLLDTLRTNGISDFALNEITTNVEAGSEVIVPVQNIRINEWNGTGYIISNENGYSFMLSNGTNGGETSESNDMWDDFYEQCEKNAEESGYDYGEAWFWLLVFAIIAYIVAVVALCAVIASTIPVGALLIWKISCATIALFFAWKGVYDATTDLVEYHNGEKTAKENVWTFGNIWKELASYLFDFLGVIPK